jgi:hypothetical protein
MKQSSQRSRRLRLAILPLPIFALCAACAQSPGKPALSVELPQDCERLAEPVPVPEIRKGMSAKVALARTSAALGTANDHLASTRACQEAQRQSYASAFPDPVK